MNSPSSSPIALSTNSSLPTGSPSSGASSSSIFHFLDSSSIRARLFLSISAISSGVLGLTLFLALCSARRLSRSRRRPSFEPSFAEKVCWGGLESSSAFLLALSFFLSRFRRSDSSSFFVLVLMFGRAGMFFKPLLFRALLTALLISLNETPCVSRGSMLVFSRPSAFVSLSPADSPPLTFLNTTNLCSPAVYSGKYSSRFVRKSTVESIDANCTLGYVPRRFATACFTYGSGFPPFSKRPQTSLLRHFSFKSLVFSILAAWGSNICFRSLVNIAPVFKCFSGTCLGGPTLPETKTVGLFFLLSLNLS
mmetsp:Transcript_33916/g.81153  ORF Transcript_33916/g.81153 Transcript_33916/m.81153 type:complete len:308 (+) Transcript_33916:388-1311(+)